MTWKDGSLLLLDQTLLPLEYIEKDCRSIEAIAEAIRLLRVRGAPAIGVAAAFGVVIGAQEIMATTRESFLKELDSKIDFLAATRPTAVNLFWALDRMRRTAHGAVGAEVAEIKEILLKEALTIQEEDRAICRKMGFNGAELLQDGMTVLTHCNAGGLATSGYGYACAVAHLCHTRHRRHILC